MPSTYTPNLNLELIATGEQDGTWGETTNDNLELIDTAAAVAEDNSTAITAIESAQATQDAAIATNASGIATNTGAIATNASGIATNTSAIATNASGIATNTGAIATNASGIATNTSAIATNASGIATNTGAIATNVTAIAANLAKNDAQDTLIVQIYGGLVTNNGLIATNTAAIALNTAKVTYTDLLPLDNTWTGTNAFNNTVSVGTGALTDEPLCVAGDIKASTGTGSGVLHFGITSDVTKLVGRDASHATKPNTLEFWTASSKQGEFDATGTLYAYQGIDVTGSILASGNITAYSDIRLKKDIAVISNPLDVVAGINGVKYTEIKTGKRRTGVIAQAVREVIPEAVLEDAEGMLSVDYGNLVGVCIEAIKELKAEIEELKAGK